MRKGGKKVEEKKRRGMTRQCQHESKEISVG